MKTCTSSTCTDPRPPGEPSSRPARFHGGELCSLCDQRRRRDEKRGGPPRRRGLVRLPGLRVPPEIKEALEAGAAERSVSLYERVRELVENAPEVQAHLARNG